MNQVESFRDFWTKSITSHVYNESRRSPVFLGSYLTQETNNIKRGAEILKRFLCKKFSPPPGFELSVNVGNISDIFKQAPCSNCHVSINGVGDSFNKYKKDGFVNSDFTAIDYTLDIDGKQSSGPLDSLPDKISSSQDAKICFVQRWIEVTMGDVKDYNLWHEQVTYFRDNPDPTILAILTNIYQSPYFLYRTAKK